MLTYVTGQAELLRKIDDSTISYGGALFNLGQKHVHADMAELKPALFESVKTSVTITAGLGDLPLDYLAMREVLDSDGYTLSKYDRNAILDTDTAAMPNYWYIRGRKATTTYNQQIGVRPVVASGTISIFYIPEPADWDGTGDILFLPDERAQRIGILWSAYEYYTNKRRMKLAGDMLALYEREIEKYAEKFEDMEEIVVGEEPTRPIFRLTN